MFTAMSIAQGGCGLPTLADAVYDYFVTGKCTYVTVSLPDLPDEKLKKLVEKVSTVLFCSLPSTTTTKNIYRMCMHASIASCLLNGIVTYVLMCITHYSVSSKKLFLK